MPTHPTLQRLILSMLRDRTGTICPSEVAREASTDWRPLMPKVRQAAAQLAKQGKVVVTQKGKPVDPLTAHGPIRIATAPSKAPSTPDGRYIVVRDRLWRAANPNLSPTERQELVNDLMTARRAVKKALNANDPTKLRRARAAVNAAKTSLGERGPVWWTDGTPDFNKYLAKNTPYASWWARQSPAR